MLTTDERGLFNNYAQEPAVYVAEFPNEDQQRRYALQGAIATLLLSLVFLTALAVN